MKKLIVFDLDGTLAESKSAVDPEMSGLLHELLGIAKVAGSPEAVGRSLKGKLSLNFLMTNA